eukprot:scaffold133191_cov27-Prasinocladus_malaysianus.AAC.2
MCPGVNGSSFGTGGGLRGQGYCEVEAAPPGRGPGGQAGRSDEVDHSIMMTTMFAMTRTLHTLLTLHNTNQTHDV